MYKYRYTRHCLLLNIHKNWSWCWTFSYINKSSCQTYIYITNVMLKMASPFFRKLCINLKCGRQMRQQRHARWCTVLSCAVLCCAVLCCTVLCCTVLCCTVLYCTVLYCNVLSCAVLHCTALRLTYLLLKTPVLPNWWNVLQRRIENSQLSLKHYINTNFSTHGTVCVQWNAADCYRCICLFRLNMLVTNSVTTLCK